MNVLGISASARTWGNTDILVWQALLGARAGGARVRFTRLPDADLKPCSGCMRCVFKGEACAVDDGLGQLLDDLRWADGVVLGAPTYVLGAAGVVKLLQDRMIAFGQRRELRGRGGLVLATAGVTGWEPLALPQLATFFLFLGMPVVDQLVGYGQGPGEILDDTEACARARTGGAALAAGDLAYRGAPGLCPVCHLDLVVETIPGQPRCTLCDLPGTWAEAPRQLVPNPGAEARWTAAQLEHHFEERVLPSGRRFKGRLRELKGRLDGLRQEVGNG